MIAHNMDVEGLFDFYCGEPRCSYASLAWPTEEIAQRRADEHMREHTDMIPMTDMSDFMKSVGMVE